MKKLIVFGLSVLMLTAAMAQEKPGKDTTPLPKKTKVPPDTAFKNPIYKGPAEIDSINKSDSIKGGSRTNPINRYKEDYRKDSVPKAPRLY